MNVEDVIRKQKFVRLDKFIFGETFSSGVFNKTKANSKNKFWGLTGSPDFSKIIVHSELLDWQKDKFAKGLVPFWKRSSFIKRLIIFALILFFIIRPLIVFVFGSFFFIFILLFFFIFAVAFLGIYFEEINNLKQDVVKSEVAKKRGWLYDPAIDEVVGFNLAAMFPKIFNLGDERFVDDQLWGSFDVDGVTKNFYSGIYCYTVINKNSKGGENKVKHFSNFFAINLEKRLPVNFLLYPESIFSRVSQKFNNHEIEVESIEFNKIFAFDYAGRKDEQAVEIVKVLSPAVQLELVDLSKKGKNLSVYFVDGVLIFSFKGKLFKKLKTQLIGGLNLVDDDLKFFDDYLQSIKTIATEIIKKL